ncbi:MAG TPA: hypothetical protein VNN80_25865 [Polyangiaceae bacterium]|nr:hypothetical protein [Polyangiaceae bacterium]
MKNGWTRWVSVALVLSAALLSVSDAHAERIVLLQFSGRKASVLRKKVEESLERSGHTVVTTKASSKSTSKTIKRVGKRGDIVLAGKVQRARKGDWSIALTVNDAKSGEPIGEDIEFSSEWLPGLTKDLQDNVSRRVEAVMAGEADSPLPPAPEPKAKAKAKPEPAPEVAALDAQLAASSDDSPSGESAGDDASASAGDDVMADQGSDDAGDDAAKEGGMVVRLRARGGYVRREFDFSDDIYDRLRKQGTNIWVYQAQGELYPFERPIGERLGLILSYEGTITGSVRDTDFGGTYPVVFSELFGGVRARHPLGHHWVGFDLTFGQMRSGLDDGNGQADIPDMAYTLIRSSLDFKLAFGAVNATGSAGFRLPLGFGEASEAEWFPRIGGYGFEAGLGVEYPLSKRVSLEALGTLRRYLLEMNSQPRDAMLGVAEVAGGAVDLYLSAYFGVSLTL